MSQTEHKQNIMKAQKNIEKMKPLLKEVKLRQRYHFMTEEGWLNDPNGLIYFNNQYHFFYQYNPYDSFWGTMHWGHAVSSDLLHWEYLPIALAPSESYDNHKEGGCFSGSAIDDNGVLTLLYTGATKKDGSPIQTQCLATSSDGIHFEKYEGNPVIKAPPVTGGVDFRDPKVWKHKDTFYMVCGTAKDKLGKAVLYKSKDLREWEYVNVLAESRGEFGYMWECPDFFPLGDKHVLTFSPMGVHDRKAIYLEGKMDYQTGRFDYTTMGEIDWGFDFYAPQSFLDSKGRRIIVGWANSWDWMPWFKDWGPTYKENWCGSFSIPREVKLCEDNTLIFVPVEELKQLRFNGQSEENINIDKEKYFIYAGDGVAYELKLKVDLRKTTANEFSLLLRCNGKEKTVITFNLKIGEITFDRNHSDGWSKGISRSILKKEDKDILRIHLFSDQSSIELFTDNYKTVHSGNIYAGNENNQNYIVPKNGSVYIKRLESWGMKASMNSTEPSL